MPYTKEDAARREKQLQEDRAARKKEMAELPPARRPGLSPVFAKPYGNTSSYTPATDMHAAQFIPSADVYSPPAQNADTDGAGYQVPDRSDSYPEPEGGGGTFDGGGASGDWS